MCKYPFLITAFIFFSCKNHNTNQSNIEIGCDTVKNLYAAGFRIIKHLSNTTIEIKNPWEHANNIVIKYILSNKAGFEDKACSNIFIKVPVHRVVCMSTTHIAFLDALGVLGTIKGISGSKLVSNHTIVNGLNRKELVDIGYEQQLNYEMLVSLKPDILFAYGVGSEVSGDIHKLRELGIPVVLVGEYLETHPLAKAEWIKFFAEFFNKQELAAKIFDTINYQYNTLKGISLKDSFKPSVIINLPWNGSWYVAGGKSYIAQLIEDAGGNYLWKSYKTRESFPIKFESVFHFSSAADIWINAGTATSKQDILSVDSRLSNLKPFKMDNVYNNNLRLNNYGGNDFWESGVMNPQIILKDLIKIFHDKLLPDYKLYYYKNLQ